MKKTLLITVIVTSLLLLAGLTFVYINRDKRTQPEGIYMNQADAQILKSALDIKAYNNGDFVTFEEACATFSGSLIPDRIGFFTKLPEDKSSIDYKLYSLAKIYKKDFFITKDHWYELFDLYLQINGLGEVVTLEEIVSLGTGVEIWNNVTQEYLDNNVLHTVDGDFSFISNEFKGRRFERILAYKMEDAYLTVRNSGDEEYALLNVWTKKLEGRGNGLYYRDYEISLPVGFLDDSKLDTICDLTFVLGELKEVKAKTDYISGKVLEINDSGVEIEGIGTIPITDECQIYETFNEVSNSTLHKIHLGYDFTDFYLDDGNVSAINIARYEPMDKIRVLIDASDYTGRFHESVSLTANTKFDVTYGEYGSQVTEAYEAGEVVEISLDDDKVANGRRVFVSTENQGGKIQLKSVKRSQGTPGYGGTIEITKKDEGLCVVNEVPLENYLYSVVPSEMPASYPGEALKVQAVCARTYAYTRMLSTGLMSLGAHLDDSASFQVYNNINENNSTNQAVNATKGELLFYGPDMATTYFYSTSIGYSVDGSRFADPDTTPFLVAKGIDKGCALGYRSSKPQGVELTDEEVFRKVIKSTYSEDFEVDEAFYRWTYKGIKADPEFMYARIEDLYNTNNARVEIKKESGEFESGLPEKFERILSIVPETRRLGGTLYTLLIETEKDEIRIIGENNVGYILTDGSTKVTLNNNKTYGAEKFFPSPWWCIDTSLKDGEVVGYDIYGGGFGHGIGMSQNGARDMADSGMNCKQILEFFYEGCEVREHESN